MNEHQLHVKYMKALGELRALLNQGNHVDRDATLICVLKYLKLCGDVRANKYLYENITPTLYFSLGEIKQFIQHRWDVDVMVFSASTGPYYISGGAGQAGKEFNNHLKQLALQIELTS